mgnify:CR=1 FL=1
MTTECERIGVVSGRYPITRFRSPENHIAYCKQNGYTYIHCNWPTGEAIPYTNKIEYISYYLGMFEYVFWLDDDAFFVDFKKKLELLLPTGE